MEPANESLQQRIAAARRRIEGLLAARVARAQSEGEILTERDPGTLARFLINTNMGLVVLARSGAAAEELEEIARLAVSTVCG